MTFAVGVGLLASAPAFGCGGNDGLPDNAVAEVGEAVITESDFERAFMRAAGRGGDPRDRAACIAAKQQEAARESASTTPTRSEFEQQCKEDYDRLERRVMESLINDEWFRQEAETRRIVVTDAEVQDAIDKARESGFLSDETLERSGLTLKDLARNARETQLHGKVTEQLTDGTMAVSARDIADYYRRHKAELVVSERRDLRLILTKTRTKARAAMLALNGGQSWVRVAKEYSLHDASRDKGGRVTDLRKGPLQSGLTATVFRAKKGELWGPVKADETSWAVFLVERIEPAFQATLDQARDDIREYLVTQRKRRALAAFTKKYREMTTCARGFRVPACKNGPKET